MMSASIYLCESECKQVVQNAKQPGSIISYVLSPKTNGAMGFLGEYLDLIVVTQDSLGKTHTRTYFVKARPMLSGEDESINAIFRKEVEIYRKVLSALDTYDIHWKPKCYFLRHNLIVLEDLTKSKYVHIPDSMEFGIDHIHAVLESLAAMHASSISYEVQKRIDIGRNCGELYYETTIRRDVEWFKTGVKCLKQIARMHPKYQSQLYQDFINNYFEALIEPVFDMVKESRHFRNVICHRDTWRNNIMFLLEERRPVRCTLVDFQFCRYSPPAIDVLLTLYLNMRRQKREHFKEHCLQYYYENLLRQLAMYAINCNDHLPWCAFMASCEHLKLFPILYHGLAATVTHVPKQYIQNLRVYNPDLYQRFRTVDRSEVVLDLLQKNDAFRDYMFEAVEELVDELVKRKFDTTGGQ